MKDNRLLEITLDDHFNVIKTQSLEPITYVGLSVINDESVFASTKSFINALENIQLQLSSQKSKALELLDFIQQKLNELNNMFLMK